jgi:hypothetical protein
VGQTPQPNTRVRGTKGFFVGLLFGGASILMSWWFTLFATDFFGVNVLQENYQLPLVWIILFGVLAGLSSWALRRGGYSASGFYTGIAVFVLLNGWCWSSYVRFHRG